MLPAKAVFRQQRQQYLCRRTHDASRRHMAAEHPALRIGQCRVKVRAVGRNRTGQRQDLHVPMKFGRLCSAGRPDPRRAQAANTLEYEGCGHSLFNAFRFEGGPQFLTGAKSQR